jgi:hypothetical protein
MIVEPTKRAIDMECGGKRSATPLDKSFDHAIHSAVSVSLAGAMN